MTINKYLGFDNCGFSENDFCFRTNCMLKKATTLYWKRRQTCIPDPGMVELGLEPRIFGPNPNTLRGIWLLYDRRDLSQSIKMSLTLMCNKPLLIGAVPVDIGRTLSR